jgi:hypothetical protein
MFASPILQVGLRNYAKAIAAGAQTERRGLAGMVRPLPLAVVPHQSLCILLYLPTRVPNLACRGAIAFGDRWL